MQQYAIASLALQSCLPPPVTSGRIVKLRHYLEDLLAKSRYPFRFNAVSLAGLPSYSAALQDVAGRERQQDKPNLMRLRRNSTLPVRASRRLA